MFFCRFQSSPFQKRNCPYKNFNFQNLRDPPPCEVVNCGRRPGRRACGVHVVCGWCVSCTHRACKVYARGMHVICVWYARGTHVACTWCGRGMHAIRTWYVLVYTWYPRGIHVVCMWYALGTHVVCTRYARDMHVVCTWSARGMHAVCTWHACNMRAVRTYLRHVYTHLLTCSLFNMCTSLGKKKCRFGVCPQTRHQVPRPPTNATT